MPYRILNFHPFLMVFPYSLQYVILIQNYYFVNLLLIWGLNSHSITPSRPLFKFHFFEMFSWKFPFFGVFVQNVKQVVFFSMEFISCWWLAFKITNDSKIQYDTFLKYCVVAPFIFLVAKLLRAHHRAVELMRQPQLDMIVLCLQQLND